MDTPSPPNRDRHRSLIGQLLPPRRRDEQGSAVLEFAVVLPLLVALLLGILTGGVAYTRKITIVDAVREGGRYGASLAVPSGAGGMATWEANVRERVAQISGGELSPADVCVKLVSATGGNDCGVKDPPGATAESVIRLVKVSAASPASLQFGFVEFDRVLTAKVVARYERDAG